MSETKNQARMTEVTADEMSKGMIANRLFYQSSPLISLYNSRQYVTYRAQQQEYKSGSVVIVNMSNSEVFVNPKTSYAKFELEITGANVLPTGWQSASNVFSRVRYIHSSGVELCHHQNANVFASIHNKLKQPTEWQDTQGALAKYFNNIPVGTHTVCVPLEQLSSVFRSEETLLPPFLLASSRLEINTEAGAKAFKYDALGGDYVIRNFEVHLDTYILSDSAFSMVEALAAAGRVEYVVDDYEVVQTDVQSNRADLQVNKSLGRAYETTVFLQLTNNIDIATTDSFAPDTAAAIDTTQFRVNSLYMPALPTKDSVERYMSLLQVNDKPGNYTFDEFEGGVGPSNGQLITQTLQRNQWVGKTSGLPINSSNSLRCSITLNDGLPRRALHFVNYMKIIKPFLYDKITISV